MDSTDAAVSDNGIALTALDDANETVMKEYFKQFPGEYTLPDGSDGKVIVSSEGELTMSSTDGKADNAYVDSITTSGTSVKTVKFASPDWYNSSQKPNNTLTLTWTTTVNSSYNHRAFKCTATTLYNADKTPIKGFTANSYFIANDGIFSYKYFKEGKTGDVSYVGEYVLSEAYETVTAYKQEGGKVVTTFIPPMRFELLGESTDSKNTEYAKSRLKDYANKYIVNDESGEYIEIATDGSVKLCIPKEGDEDGCAELV